MEKAFSEWNLTLLSDLSSLALLVMHAPVRVTFAEFEFDVCIMLIKVLYCWFFNVDTLIEEIDIPVSLQVKFSNSIRSQCSPPCDYVKERLKGRKSSLLQNELS